MLLCAEYVLPITSAPVEQGAVLVRGGKIHDIGSADLMRMRYPEEEVHDYGLAALMPGFVDAHTHLENSVLRGLVHDVPYATWVGAVHERGDRLTSADWVDSAVLGGLEALSAGVTTIADVTMTGAAFDAANMLGLRGVVYREVGAMDKRRINYAMKMATADLEKWAGEADSSRLKLGIAPMPIYSCHPGVYQSVSQYARKNNVPVAMHVAGSREEYNFVKYGSSAFAVDSVEGKRGFVEIPPWLPRASLLSTTC